MTLFLRVIIRVLSTGQNGLITEIYDFLYRQLELTIPGISPSRSCFSLWVYLELDLLVGRVL